MTHSGQCDRFRQHLCEQIVLHPCIRYLEGSVLPAGGDNLEGLGKGSLMTDDNQRYVVTVHELKDEPVTGARVRPERRQADL